MTRRFPSGLRAVAGIAALAAIAAPAVAVPPAQNYSLVFEDNFDGTTLDLTKWRHDWQGKRNDAVNVPEAVTLNGSGIATIRNWTAPDPVTGLATHYSDMISTRGLFEMTYGYYEARLQFKSPASGQWAAFWVHTLDVVNAGVPPLLDNPGIAGTEMDIVEYRTKRGSDNLDFSKKYQAAVHWNGYDYSGAHQQGRYVSPDLGTNVGYHTYAMEWTPTFTRFYFDGSLKWTFTDAISHRDEFMVLSSEIGNPGFAGATLPSYGTFNAPLATMDIDYVRAYALMTYEVPEPTLIGLVGPAGLLLMRRTRRQAA